MKKLIHCIVVVSFLFVACGKEDGKLVDESSQQTPRSEDSNNDDGNSNSSVETEEEKLARTEKDCLAKSSDWHWENNECLKDENLKMVGPLDSTPGILWEIGTFNCDEKPMEEGMWYQFCEGIDAWINLLPIKGKRTKIDIALSFSCKSFPSQISLDLEIAGSLKGNLASGSNSIFSSAFFIESDEPKKLTIKLDISGSSYLKEGCQINLLKFEKFAI